MDAPKNQQKAPIPVFIATTIVIFFLTLSAADSVGLIPDYLDGTAKSTNNSSEANVQLSALPELGETTNTDTQPFATKKILPTRIQIDAIGLDLGVQNPDTRDIAKLDNLLVKGPARYVDSAMLGNSGNMIIFAHSSHLPVVRNQMFKAFNRIPELKAGDTITLSGDDGISYVYSVTDIKKADAGDTTIDLSTTLGTKLTLVTCDTLTGKSARYVLSADFVGTVGE